MTSSSGSVPSGSNPVGLPEAEWLETDGLGGFAMGSANGIPFRRYHALLIGAVRPPTGRHVLVHAVEAFFVLDNQQYPLNSFRYAPNVIHPDNAILLRSFNNDPWPTWRFQCGNDATVQYEICMPWRQPRVVLTWNLELKGKRNNQKALLQVRPMISARTSHALHKKNEQLSTEYQLFGNQIVWQPYSNAPAMSAMSSGNYSHGPLWYYNFLYTEEQARGYDATEDLFSPGTFNFDLTEGEASLVFNLVPGFSASGDPMPEKEIDSANVLKSVERKRRARFPDKLEQAADAYLAKRDEGITILAGYPWFTDWGRDTFISLRGLCLATKRYKEAAQILIRWAGALDQGMLPNLFPETGQQPLYNSVDASLWFIVASYELLEALKTGSAVTYRKTSTILCDAIFEIMESFSLGTRYGIRAGHDGLLAAGVPGEQLTWMDAKINGHVVTPRIGKAVEVQALWLNCLHIASELLSDSEAKKWADVLRRAQKSFDERFWNGERDCLYDVIDVDHHPGKFDAKVRPNQIFALGGLPRAVLTDRRKAEKVLEVVARDLLTPYGLRTLAPWDPEYCRSYQGGPLERDFAYHQGTVWPWLIGAYVEAWVRQRDNTAAAKTEARDLFLKPLLSHLDIAGLGHLSEIYDPEPPFTPRGSPFQAWSLGELIRLDKIVLA